MNWRSLLQWISTGAHGGSTAENAEATLPDGGSTPPASTTPISPVDEALLTATWTDNDKAECYHCYHVEDGEPCCWCDPYWRDIDDGKRIVD